MENIAFSDWPDQHVDLNGSNTWLPAYGCQQPIFDKDDFLGSPDAALFLNGNATYAHQYVSLETIVEETSDDLRSDGSERSTSRASFRDDSDNAFGWLATDSDSTSSVVRLKIRDVNEDAYLEEDSVSESDIVCPAKRRRRQSEALNQTYLIVPSDAHINGYSDDDPTSTSPAPSLSRSSSLLQFETLEKRCQDDVYNSSPSILSTFSFDSLENPKSVSNYFDTAGCSNNTTTCLTDSLNTIDSSSTDSDSCEYYKSINIDGSKGLNRDSLFYKTKSLRKSEESGESDDSEVIHDVERPRIKLSRSYDGLDHIGERTQKMSTENLSEDSGYGEYLNGVKVSVRSSSIPNIQIAANVSDVKEVPPPTRRFEKKRARNTFDAYDGELCVVNGSSASHFGTSYHDLSALDPNKINKQYKNSLQKIALGKRGFNTRLYTNNNNKGAVGGLDDFYFTIDEHDELERPTRRNSSRRLKLESAASLECVTDACLAADASPTAIISSGSASEPNLVQAVETSEDATSCATTPWPAGASATATTPSSSSNDDQNFSDCFVPNEYQLATEKFARTLEQIRLSDTFGNTLESIPESCVVDSVSPQRMKMEDNRDQNVIVIRLKDSDSDRRSYYENDREVSKSFTVNDGVTKLLDISADNRCYNLDIQADILEFEEDLQKAISNSSIPSFTEKDDFFFHSTPMNRRTVLSTPNLAAFNTQHDTFDEDFEPHRGSMQNVPLKTENNSSFKGSKKSGSEGKLEGGILGQQRSSLAGSGSVKGVHFCEIVSEVSWREVSTSESEANSGEESENDEMSLDAIMNQVADQIDQQHDVANNNEPIASSAKNGHVLLETPHAGRVATEVGATAKSEDLSFHRQTAMEVQRSKSDAAASQQTSTTAVKRSNKLGGFLSRFTNFRFSTRKNKKLTKPPISAPVVTNQNSHAEVPNRQDYIYIPLKGPSASQIGNLNGNSVTSNSNNVNQLNVNSASTNVIGDGRGLAPLHSNRSLSSKPPLPKMPPRVIGASVKRQTSGGSHATNPTQTQTPVVVQGNSPRSGIDCSGTTSSGKRESHLQSYSHGGRHYSAGGQSRGVYDRDVFDLSMEESSTPRLGLIETDLDTQITTCVTTTGIAAANVNGKTRSLMNLGYGAPRTGATSVVDTDIDATHNRVPTANGRLATNHLHDIHATVRPHKSMEFLLDKQNLKVVEPPENELQKGLGERVMSEHQLRVQRSLQKLNVPEWFKQSQVPREGFLLKKTRDNTKWSGLSGKTTSLSSLGSRQSPILLSPSSQVSTGTNYGGGTAFSRWSTSKLNSTASSPCNSTRSSFNYRQPVVMNVNGGLTSPCSSTRSSFNYRQPYLGWRSQERLARPRTPAERLATSLLPPPSSQPNTEIQSSIKEVTSAIVHYVSGLRPEDANTSDRDLSRLGGSDYDNLSQRSVSPARGSQKFCWLESSFVGTRPLDSPQTPIGIATDSSSETIRTVAANTITTSTPTSLHLDLKSKTSVNNDFSSSSKFEDGVSTLNLITTRPSPGSTTLEDVLDSLLGLPPSTRAPSPSLQETGLASSSPGRISLGGIRRNLLQAGSLYQNDEIVRRRSEGSGGLDIKNALEVRRVSFHATSPATPQDTDTNSEARTTEVTQSTVIRCRYSKCMKEVSTKEATKSFKNCHNCNYTYCSRECRRAHWEKHRRTCLHSRASSLCRQILAKAKDDSNTLQHISRVARRGFLSQGPGVVKCFFPSPEAAERFLANGLADLTEPTYIRWPDLLPSEMGPELFSELVKICKSYNPETRLVLYISVCVVSEVPTTGTIKWERQLVSRCAKLRLSKKDAETISRSKSPQEMDNPETLILTSSLPNEDGNCNISVQRSREISFTNIQRQLRQRGVNLKRHFPEVYHKLAAYVEGTSDKFAPIIVYPRDASSGKNFMCVIMPDTETHKLNTTTDPNSEQKPD